MSFSSHNSKLLYEKCKTNQTKQALDILNDLDNQRININEKFDSGCTAVFMAAYNGNLELVKALVAKGADVNIAESNEVTPFTVACVNGKISVVEYILENFSATLDPNTIVTGLAGACQYGYPQVIKRLLDRGVDVNMFLDEEGATCLYLACETAQEIVIALLLNNGANPNLPRGKYYPLHLASQAGNLKIMENLLKHDADPDVQIPDGATSLLIAAQNGRISSVDLLYKYNANPNIQMKTDGSTPLYVAAARHHKNTVKALLENPKLDITLALNDGTNILHLLCQFGHLDIIQDMFEKFPNDISKIINVKRKDGTSPLHLAARHGQAEICSLLLSNGANINDTCDGDTALSVATRYGRADTIKVLQDALNNSNNK
ncbi:hypothetical protein CYY_004769 [Polysphondylium violaceum]|uniref:Ankyrin repeat-containing protein n=1 Tax=Polysphondylium violaceum TaxID=133409 RepID=A0A8J4PUQ1_9MYCE|nr:hypothetical protein CYY_004769 [Polysphondylium violaceum]